MFRPEVLTDEEKIQGDPCYCNDTPHACESPGCEHAPHERGEN